MISHRFNFGTYGCQGDEWKTKGEEFAKHWDTRWYLHCLDYNLLKSKNIDGQFTVITVNSLSLKDRSDYGKWQIMVLPCSEIPTREKLCTGMCVIR